MSDIQKYDFVKNLYNKRVPFELALILSAINGINIDEFENLAKTISSEYGE